MRKARFLAACAGLSLMVAAVGVTHAATSARPVTLTLWEEPVTERFEAALQIVAEFERQNPDIKVEVISTPAIPQRTDKLLVAVAGGQAPDVVAFWGADFRRLAVDGLWLDIEPYVQRHMSKTDLADFYPGQMEFFKMGNKRFGLPQYAGSIATYTNRTMFNMAGVPLPKGGWTTDDLVSISRKLTMDVSGDGEPDRWGFAFLRFNDRVAYWVKRMGGSMLKDNDSRQFGLSQPESLAALEWLQGLITRDRISPLSTSDARWKFEAGNMGIMENGSWQVATAKLYNAPFEIGLMEPPRGPKGPHSLLTSDGYAILSTTKHPDEAFRLLQFLASSYGSKTRAVVAGLQPCRRSVARAWIENMPHRFPTMPDVDWMAFFRAAEYSQPEPVFHRHAEVWRALSPALNEIWKGEPPQSAIARVAGQINALLQE